LRNRIDLEKIKSMGIDRKFLDDWHIDVADLDITLEKIYFLENELVVLCNYRNQ
jgi:hypothetical protein